MAEIFDIRPFQAAKRYRDKPNLYRALVRDIATEQRHGFSGQLPLHNARLHQRPGEAMPPKGAA